VANNNFIFLFMNFISKKHIVCKALVFLYLLGWVGKADAQTRQPVYNNIAWGCYFGDHKLSDKWGIHTEYQWRRTDFGLTWQQSLARVGVNYQLHPRVMLTLGYGLIHTFSYGDLPISRLNNAGMAQIFPEHRIYQDVLVTDKIGKVEMSHRFRLEQRYMGLFYDNENNRIAGKWKLFNRLRYRIRLAYPITEKWYVHGYDELFIGFGKDVGYNIFDQNRVNLGFGYKFNKQGKIEAGYFSQTVQKPRLVNNLQVFEYNQGFLVALFYNLHFKKTTKNYGKNN
jgi:hypothetical protein